MAVPRNRSSNQRKRTKRSHHALHKKSFSDCTNCGSYHIPHAICPSCGYYKGRSVIKSQENASE